MKKILTAGLLGITLCTSAFAQIGKVGINTTTPAAMLHVKDSSVVFTSPYYENFPQYDAPPPVSGAGARMMWYPQRRSLRTGMVTGTQWNQASTGFYSFASGYNPIANGEGATAIGKEVIANGYNGLVIGHFNDPVVNSPQTLMEPTTPLFIIGNGDNNANRSNALTVLKNGRIGIGTIAPAARLHVEDQSVLFRAPATLPGTPGSPPVSGAGNRMMWYADKAAFRVGEVSGTNWDKDSIGYHSFASGVNTKAKGLRSTAMGYNTQATNINSTAFGLTTLASGNTSTSMGGSTTASGDYSTTMGFNTVAEGDYSVAMGRDNIATGDHAITMGKDNTASGGYSTAFGNQTTASGFYAVTMGNQTTASSHGAFASGDETVASGFTSFAIGTQTTAGGNYSFAGGFQSTTSGQHNFAFGYNASTSGESAIALGYQASADNGIAIGNNANGSATNALALGDHAFANGNSSVAIGKNASAGGEEAIALGGSTNASGYRAMALGYNSTASSLYGIAIGVSTITSGGQAISTGVSTKAKGDYSFASGVQTIAKSYNSFIAGRYNDTTSVSSTSWIETDPIFIVGNGSANNDRKNAMTLLKSGKLGLGTVAPVNLLHLRAANDTINGPILSLGGTSPDQAESGRIRFYEGTASNNLRGGYIHLDGAANRFHIGIHPTSDNIVSNDVDAISIDRASGEVGIGTANPNYLLEVNGTAGKPGGGSWTNSSDARLKQQVEPYSDGLQSILAIRPVRFHYNTHSGYDPSKEYVGVIAQELQVVAPYMVNTSARILPDGSTGYLDVDNSAMTYMLINAVKEQQEIINTQQDRIDALEKEMQEIRALLQGVTQK